MDAEEAELAQLERARFASKRSKNVRFVVVDAVPRAPALPRAVAKHVSGEFDLVAVAGKHAVIVQRTELGDGALVVIADGRASKAKERVTGACIAHDGSAAYAIAHERTVIRTEIAGATGAVLPAATARRAKTQAGAVFGAAGRLTDLAVIGARYLVAGGHNGTDVIDLQAIERGSFATLPGTSTWVRPHPAMGSVLDGRVLWLRCSNDRSTLFATIIDGSLVGIAKLGIGVVVEERDGRVFGRTQFNAVRIDGLEEALANAKPPRKKRVLAIDLRQIDAPKPQPKPPAAWLAKVKYEITIWRVSPSGRFVGYDGETTGKLYWLDDSGRRHEFKPAGMPRNFEADAGAGIVLATHDTVTLIDANSDAAKALHYKRSRLVGVAYAADGLLAVQASDAIRLVDRRGSTRHSVRTPKASFVHALHEGRTLIVSSRGKTTLEVFSVARGKLARRFRSSLDWSQADVRDGRYVVQAVTGVWFELDVSSLG